MAAPWYRWDGDTLTVTVYVQPRAAKDRVVGVHGSALKISLTAPPVDGRANALLLRTLARAFKVKPSQVALVRGDTARYKTVTILSPAVAPEALLEGEVSDL
jgi:uncharacterized protein (TIGR00251 family)